MAWSAKDGETPILFTIDGVTYEIAAGNTDKKYIYWDSGYTTLFQSTDSEASVIGKVVVAINNSGTAVPAFFKQLIHAGLIQANTITASQLTTGELITLAAQIKDAVITNAKIASLDAAKINSRYDCGGPC